MDIDPDNNAVSFAVSVVGALIPDPYEPNDSPDEATDPSEFLNTTIEATIGEPGDEDWYRIDDVSDGTRIVASLRSVPADYDLFLFDATGKQVKSSTGAGTSDESFNYRARRSTGTYYLLVVGWNGASSALDSYELTTELR